MTSEPGVPADLPAVFGHMAEALEPRYDLIDTMDLIVQSAGAFTAAVDAGIVLADSAGVLHLLASTSERTSDVEDVQVETLQGPCMDSYRFGQTVETPRLSAVRGRWPRFVQVAEQRGFRAGHAVPITLRGRHLGALNLFLDRPSVLTDSDSAVAQLLAQVATTGIVQRRVLQRHAQPGGQFQRALAGRILIEQAKGALAYQRDVSIDEAFTLLRAYARRTGARIRDVAEQVVNRRATI